MQYYLIDKYGMFGKLLKFLNHCINFLSKNYNNLSYFIFTPHFNSSNFSYFVIVMYICLSFFLISLMLFFIIGFYSN